MEENSPLSVVSTSWENEAGFSGVQRLSYRGASGLDDWALLWPAAGATCVVQLHGHGSHGDQLYTRADIRDAWLPVYRRHSLGILTPNLRDNAWMSPEAVDDLHRLLEWLRVTRAVRHFLFVSGSMGGTSNLIYACRHPEDVAALVALCPATDIGAYARWCGTQSLPIVGEIYEAIVSAYGGTPDEQPQRYADHSALRHAERLTMPVFMSHGDDDALIPVEEARLLAAAMQGRSNFIYEEIPGGHHDSPLHHFDAESWLCEQLRTLD
jgi:pimeloyl-ACP methyl ester carboxylesterase